MKIFGLQAAILAVLVFPGVETLRAQPTASPTSFSFTYQVNSATLPAAGKLTATLPKTAATGYTLTASVTPVMGWLTVTPGSGSSPLTLTVTVNPTGLSPGSYSGVITLGTNPGSSTTLVPVTLSISNPPSSIAVSPASTVTNYTPGVSGANPTLAFNYTTGQTNALPVSTELDVASNGGIIPFTVAAVSGSKTVTWLKINVANQLPNLQTSGVALSGSYVPIYVTIDFNALSHAQRRAVHRDHHFYQQCERRSRSHSQCESERLRRAADHHLHLSDKRDRRPLEWARAAGDHDLR